MTDYYSIITKKNDPAEYSEKIYLCRDYTHTEVRLDYNLQTHEAYYNARPVAFVCLVDPDGKLIDRHELDYVQ